MILARSGSKGLPNKNLLSINEKTLIELAIETSLAAETLDNVVFSTEDPDYAQIAKSCGIESPIIRPHELSSDTASSWDVVRHAVNFFESNLPVEPSVVVLIQPTTPLRTAQHIDKTVRMVVDNGFEAAITVRAIQYPVEWMFWINEKKHAVPVLPNSKKITRRQEASKVFQPAGTAYAVTRRRLNSIDPVEKDGLGFVLAHIAQNAVEGLSLCFGT